MAELARQVEVLLRHKRPDDVEALWVYVISVFEKRSLLRRMLVESISQRAKEMYMTIEEDLLARGQKIGKKIGRALGKAEAVLGVLAHRKLPVSAAVRRRVLASRDELELQRWFECAFAVTSAQELFAVGEPVKRPRGRAAGAAAGQARGGRRLVAA